MGQQLPHHLPNLNGIRFLAALTVVLSHVEVYRAMTGLPHLTAIMGVFAGFGVDIFFALSGFLITNLLLIEQQKNQRIHIGHFYMRRVLRIWPLYFFILSLGSLLELFLHNSSQLLSPFNTEAFLYYLFFLPQIGKGFFIGSLCVVILWSIGVEELFYLVYPWIFRRIGKRPITWLSVLISVLLLSKIIIIYLLFKFAPSSWSESAIKTITMTRFENLLVGAALAFSAIRWRPKFESNGYVMLPATMLLCLLFILGAQNVNFYISESIGPILQKVLNPFLASALMGVIICFLVLNKRYAGMLEKPSLDYLGKISFGLYVYHCLALTLLSMLPDAWIPTSWASIFTTTLVLTIGMASLSYRYMEKPFLRLSGAYRHI
jgi:peptidoglycan/LPS O-acetylase OafA/YrhL